MERRLTTILAIDVTGYSRLMGEDETTTLNTLKAHRSRIFEPKAAEHGGRTIKLMGDGILMEFASVVGAVSFAIDVQCALRDENASLRELVERLGEPPGSVVRSEVRIPRSPEGKNAVASGVTGMTETEEEKWAARGGFATPEPAR